MSTTEQNRVEQREDGTWSVFDVADGALRPGRFVDRADAERAARICECCRGRRAKGGGA